MKLFCEECAHPICAECFIDKHMGHKFTQMADKAKKSRKEANELLEKIKSREDQVTKFTNALKQINRQMSSKGLEDEISQNVAKAKESLDVLGKQMMEQVKLNVECNKAVISDRIKELTSQREKLGTLKQSCNDVLDCSDAKALDCIPSVLAEANEIVNEEPIATFSYKESALKPFEGVGHQASCQLLLGDLSFQEQNVQLDEVEIDPLYEEIEALSLHQKPRYENVDDFLENLPTLPSIVPFEPMYTYDSPQSPPRQSEAAFLQNPETSANEPINSSNTSNPITWSQNFGYVAAALSNGATTSGYASSNSSDGSMPRTKTWSSILQNDADPSSAALPKSSSSSSLPKSINYDTSRSTASPMSNSSGDFYLEDRADILDDPRRITVELNNEWERTGSNIVAVDVTSNGNIAVTDKDSFNVYSTEGRLILSNNRKYPPKCMAFITVDKIEYAVELHRDNILRFHTRDGYALPPGVLPTYDTRQLTQLHMATAGQMLFLTYSGDSFMGEADFDHIKVYECGRIPPSPVKQFDTSLKGLRSMCALDTQTRGTIIVVACANYCQKRQERPDTILVALDLNGNPVWQLDWRNFPGLQVVAGKVRYDLKDMCTDGNLIYVVDKISKTVYAISKDGTKIRPIVELGANDQPTHIAVNKRTNELIVVVSGGYFSIYKMKSVTPLI